jgi:hypothetical protein
MRGMKMSLELSNERVTRVLLVDGWHPVDTGSFRCDECEYDKFFDGDPLHDKPWKRLCTGHALGFSFTETGSQEVISGPMASILAVATKN